MEEQKHQLEIEQQYASDLKVLRSSRQHKVFKKLGLVDSNGEVIHEESEMIVPQVSFVPSAEKTGASGEESGTIEQQMTDGSSVLEQKQSSNVSGKQKSAAVLTMESGEDVTVKQISASATVVSLNQKSGSKGSVIQKSGSGLSETKKSGSAMSETKRSGSGLSETKKSGSGMSATRKSGSVVAEGGDSGKVHVSEE